RVPIRSHQRQHLTLVVQHPEGQRLRRSRSADHQPVALRLHVQAGRTSIGQECHRVHSVTSSAATSSGRRLRVPASARRTDSNSCCWAGAEGSPRMLPVPPVSPLRTRSGLATLAAGGSWLAAAFGPSDVPPAGSERALATLAALVASTESPSGAS